MNIENGLRKLDEISCDLIHSGHLRQILEAMKSPSGCDGLERYAELAAKSFLDIEQRIQHLEKLEDYVKELKDRVERLEEQAKIAGRIIFKPSERIECSLKDWTPSNPH